MPEKMNLKGLTFKRGTSYEQVQDFLTRRKILFQSNCDLMSNRGYFRDSKIFGIQIEHRPEIVGQFGKPFVINRGVESYSGEYEIEREFDLSQLDGAVEFNQGLLIERVRIKYQH